MVKIVQISLKPTKEKLKLLLELIAKDFLKYQNLTLEGNTQSSKSLKILQL